MALINSNSDKYSKTPTIKEPIVMVPVTLGIKHPSNALQRVDTQHHCKGTATPSSALLSLKQAMDTTWA